MNNNPFLIYDAVKTKIDFTPWGGIEGFLAATSNGTGPGTTEARLRRISPWLSRAVTMTAVSIANLPFDIVDRKAGNTKAVPPKPKEKGKKPDKPEPAFDSSDDWQNKLGGMPNPKRLIYLLAASLCGGKAYVIPELGASENILTNLQYVAPHTITPYIDMAGLQWFDRADELGNVDKYMPESLMYFWLPDPDVEIGPALTHPIGAAVTAAQTVHGMDDAVRLLADRKFIPATIVAATGMANEESRKAAENWLTRFFRGRFQTEPAKLMNAEAATVVKVGGGMEDLKTGFSEIQRGEIEAVGAAFGIPAGLFMSDKAYATEMDAVIRMWYSSSQFVSIYQCIEETFNDQLFGKWNKRMQFKPETLDAFQEDETARAASFKVYVDAGVRPSIAAETLGIELPEGVEYSDLDEKFDKPTPGFDPQGNPLPKPVIMPIQDGQKPPPKPQPRQPFPPRKTTILNPDQVKELGTWLDVARRQMKLGKPANQTVDWKCEFLPAEVENQIKTAMMSAVNELDLVRAFEIKPEPDEGVAVETKDSGLFAVAEALNRLADK